MPRRTASGRTAANPSTSVFAGLPGPAKYAASVAASTPGPRPPRDSPRAHPVVIRDQPEESEAARQAHRDTSEYWCEGVTLGEPNIARAPRPQFHIEPSRSTGTGRIRVPRQDRALIGAIVGVQGHDLHRLRLRRSSRLRVLPALRAAPVRRRRGEDGARGRAARAPAPPPPAPPTREADRRQVTVLFADLTGFTALSERLDPEVVRAFQTALFDTLAQAIARYDGFVEKFVGDAVMAVFGAPVAHEDDPQRAVGAALDMLERAATLSRQWERRLGQPVTLHIGLHTGPVVAGSLGGGTEAAYAVTGDTVNTTSRLLSAAEPGTILVSEATYRLAQHSFAFESAGTVTAKGKTEPIVVHRVLGALAEPGSARGLAALGLAAPLVGRDAELAQLMAAFAAMREGRAQVVSVVGEAGTGKSRLIAELFARLGADADGRIAGIAVRRAACSSLGEPTYGVFGALFRDAYRVDPADSLEVARAKLIAGLRVLGARDEEAEAIAPVLSYVLGRGGGQAPRHRAGAAPAPDRAGRADPDRAAAAAGAAAHRHRGSPLGRRGLRRAPAPCGRSPGGPAADVPPLASAGGAPAAGHARRALGDPARPALAPGHARAGERALRARWRATRSASSATWSPTGPAATRSSSRRSCAA